MPEVSTADLVMAYTILCKAPTCSVHHKRTCEEALTNLQALQKVALSACLFQGWQVTPKLKPYWVVRNSDWLTGKGSLLIDGGRGIIHKVQCTVLYCIYKAPSGSAENNEWTDPYVSRIKAVILLHSFALWFKIAVSYFWSFGRCSDVSWQNNFSNSPEVLHFPDESAYQIYSPLLGCKWTLIDQMPEGWSCSHSAIISIYYEYFLMHLLIKQVVRWPKKVLNVMSATPFVWLWSMFLYVCISPSLAHVPNGNVPTGKRIAIEQ